MDPGLEAEIGSLLAKLARVERSWSTVAITKFFFSQDSKMYREQEFCAFDAGRGYN